MANIDELHWSAILDTKDFDAKAEYLRKEAKRLNVELSKMLDIYQKFKGKTLITEKGVENAREMNSVLSDIQQKINSLPSSVKIYEKGTENVEKNVERTNAHYQVQSNLLRQISTLAGTYFSIRGAERFLRSLIDITGEFEKQKMSLTSMLQSSEVADNLFNQYRELALKSPYTFQDFTKFGKQLLAFNIPQEELVNTTKMLADVAAGLGVDMGRIILAYGQIKSAGILKGTELRQLTEAGVPILDSLAKQIEETTGKAVKLGDVFAMISKKQIPFEMVEKAFRDMTSEGGKFYNMQEVLVETLWGKIGKLRDVWQQTLYDIGKGGVVNDILKDSIDGVTNSLSHLGRLIADIIVSFATYKLVIIAAEKANGSFLISNHKILSSFKSISKWISNNPYAILAASVTLVAIAFVNVVKNMRAMNEMQEKIKRAQSDYNTDVIKGVSELDRLYTQLKLAKRGTKEYEEAVKSIQSRYGEYITQLHNEGVEVGNLATLYDALRQKIEQAARARFVAAARSDIDSVYEAGLKGVMEGANGDDIYNLKRAAKELRLTPAEEKALAMLVGGFTTKEELSKDIETASLLAKIKRNRISLGPGSSGPMDAEKYIDILIQKVQNLKTDYKSASDMIERFADDLPKTTVTPTTTNVQSGTTERVEELYDWDKVLQELDKQLMSDIDRDTREFEKEFDKRMKALGAFSDFFDKLDNTGINEGGKGVTGKVKGLLFDYKGDNYKVLVEYRKQLENIKTAYGENSKAYENAKRKLDAWRDSAEAANKTKLFERVRELSDDVFKEGMFGYDLTNWNDKTLAQIKAIEQAISELDLPEELREELESVNGLLDHAVDSLNDYKNGIQKNTVSPAKWKEQLKSARMFVKYITMAASAMEAFGEALDNSNLEKFGEMLENVGDTYQAMIEGYETEGAVGAVVAGAAVMMEKLIGYLAKAADEETQMLNALKDMKGEIRGLNFEEELKDGVESLFGEDAIRSINNAATAIWKLRGRWEDLLATFEKVKVAESEQYIRAMGGGGSGILSSREWMISQIKSVEDLVFSNGKRTMTIAEAAEELGLNLKDAFGNINPELLDRIIEVYKLEDKAKDYTIDKDTLDFIKDLSEYGKEYADAMEQIATAVSDLFGNVADNMVDAFLENFKEMGNAVDNLGDTFTDLGETIVKSMLKSYILDTILKKYEDEAKSMMQAYAIGGISYDDLAQRVSAFADAVTEDTRAAGDVINAMLAAFQDRGLLGEGGEKNTLSNGIKGITEDTASLLASYINAMRSDLSYIKVLQERGWADVKGIYEAMGTFPTLNDYMAQVAATNANIAESNRQILERIDRLTTTASGRAALAVDVQ